MYAEAAKAEQTDTHTDTQDKLITTLQSRHTDTLVRGCETAGIMECLQRLLSTEHYNVCSIYIVHRKFSLNRSHVSDCARNAA